MTGELTQDYTWALQDSSLPYNATTNPYVSTLSPWINPTIPNRGDIQDTARDTDSLQFDLAGTYNFGGISSQTILGYAYAKQDAMGLVKSANLPGINLLNHVVAYPTYPADWTTKNGSSYENQQLYL